MVWYGILLEGSLPKSLTPLGAFGASILAPSALAALRSFLALYPPIFLAIHHWSQPNLDLSAESSSNSKNNATMLILLFVLILNVYVFD